LPSIHALIIASSNWSGYKYLNFSNNLFIILAAL
jgi:hypothetical protein